MSNINEKTPPKFIKVMGAVYQVAQVQPRQKIALQVPRAPYMPAPELRRPRPQGFREQVPPSEGQQVGRRALRQEVVSGIDELVQYLAEMPVGPAELMGKFNQFSSGIANLTDVVKEPLQDALKNLASVVRKLLKAKRALESVRTASRLRRPGLI